MKEKIDKKEIGIIRLKSGKPVPLEGTRLEMGETFFRDYFSEENCSDMDE